MADEGRCRRVPGRAPGCGQRQEGHLGTSLPQGQRGRWPPRPSTARPKARMPQPFQKGPRLRAARHPGDPQPRAPGGPCCQRPAGQAGHGGTQRDMGGHRGTPATLQLVNTTAPCSLRRGPRRSPQPRCRVRCPAEPRPPRRPPAHRAPCHPCCPQGLVLPSRPPARPGTPP